MLVKSVNICLYQYIRTTFAAVRSLIIVVFTKLIYLLLYFFQARIEQMGGDVSLFLQSLPFNETEIGMLQFAADASELVAMTPLDSTENLQLLLDNIPTNAIGGTCIGCGLLEALKVGGGQTSMFICSKISFIKQNKTSTIGNRIQVRFSCPQLRFGH